MIANFLKLGRFLALIMVLSLIFNPICGARSFDKPMVVRKKIISSSQPKHKPVMPEPKSALSIANSDVEDEKNMETNTALAKNPIPSYNPSNRIDPFKPLFKETPRNPSGKSTYAVTEHKGTTEIEKIDLSQLRLTGIILATSGNKALVREASGKGHIISMGSYIGTHGGRVTQVLNDKIIVEEKMKDVLGRLFIQKTELKLNKSG